LDLANNNLQLAEETKDPALIMEAEHDQGAALFYTGKPNLAMLHFDRSAQLYNPEKHYPHVFIYGKNAGATGAVHLALILGILGYPDQSIDTIKKGIALTKSFPHPFSHLWTLSGNSVVLQMYRRNEEMKPVVHELVSQAKIQGFPNWLAQGLTWLGWIQIYEGQLEEGIRNMNQGVGIWRMTGSELLLPYFIYLLADGYFKHHDYKNAISNIDQAIDLIDKTGEMWFAPEIWRLRGLLHLTIPGQENDAELILQKALDLAEYQGTKLHELRVAISLSQIWKEQGKVQAAYELLTTKYEWFSEGMETPVLVEAKNLLNSIHS
jgi:predicted ATPase